MSIPAGGPMPASSSTRMWPAVVAVVAIGLVLAVVAFFVVRSLRSDEDGSSLPGTDGHDDGQVRLEPVTYRSPSPFTPSVVSGDDGDLVALSAGVGRVDPGTVRGDTSLLYGTRAGRPACDVAALARHLTADPAVTAAWAGAAGVDVEAVERTVTSMTPVVLTRDTAVTNHVYGSDGAHPYQAVLQAGTPVLVDAHGAPRTQCSCGNPLLPPRQDGDVDYVGEPWDDFEQDDVVEIQPSESPVDQIETVDLDSKRPTSTPIGEMAILDGFLVTNDSGVHVIDRERSGATQVLDHPVAAVHDDGRGGIVFTRARSDLAIGDFEKHPPADLDEAVIWHLPAGSTEARELVGSEPGHWNRLLGVGRLGERTFVVFSPLRTDSEFDQPVATGPIVVQDLDSGERTQILEHGFGWETGTRGVSFGDDRLSLEVGYSMPDWIIFGPDLQPIDQQCSSTYASSEEELERIDSTCPWLGTLDGEGRLAYFTSILDPETTDEAVEVLDLQSGTVTARHPVAEAATTEESYTEPVQVRDGLLSAVFTINHEPSTQQGLLISLETGEIVDLGGAGVDSIRTVRVLSAPLIRPTAGPDAEQPGPERAPAPDASELDPMNMLLPGAVCQGLDGGPAKPVQLRGGEGSTGEDTMAQDYVYVTLDAERVVRMDVDGDGSDELVVSVLCNWGGSGYSTPVAALRVGEGGEPALVGEPLSDYGRTTRDVQRLSVDEPGVLSVHGGEWTDGDAACCPSLQFSARWAMQEGRWVEVGS